MEKELLNRIAELEALLSLFAQYASDAWVRDQAQTILTPED